MASNGAAARDDSCSDLSSADDAMIAACSKQAADRGLLAHGDSPEDSDSEEDSDEQSAAPSASKPKQAASGRKPPRKKAVGERPTVGS